MKPRTRMAISFIRTELDKELIEYLLPAIIHKYFNNDNTYYLIMLGELVSPNHLDSAVYLNKLEECDLIVEFVGRFLYRSNCSHIIKNLLKSYKVIDAQITSSDTIYLEWEKLYE